MDWLTSKGITVVRFWNNDGLVTGVMTESVRVAAEKAEQASIPSPTLPLSGGGGSKGVL
jgi:hypothetical protein